VNPAVQSALIGALALFAVTLLPYLVAWATARHVAHKAAVEVAAKVAREIAAAEVERKLSEKQNG
jgi:hypothetical protein